MEKIITGSNAQNYLDNNVASHSATMYARGSYPSVQAYYGPYESKELAHKVLCFAYGDFESLDSITATTTCLDIPRAFTVGIIENGSVVEYQYKKETPEQGYTANDLEVKNNTGASTVSVSPSLTSGTEVAKITIDGTEKTIYAPTPTEGSTVTVVNNLESDSITNALSAAQGKVLKGMIDAKNGADPEVVKEAVNTYLEEHPISLGKAENIETNDGSNVEEKLKGIYGLTIDIHDDFQTSGSGTKVLKSGISLKKGVETTFSAVAGAHTKIVRFYISEVNNSVAAGTYLVTFSINAASTTGSIVFTPERDYEELYVLFYTQEGNNDGSYSIKAKIEGKLDEFEKSINDVKDKVDTFNESLGGLGFTKLELDNFVDGMYVNKNGGTSQFSSAKIYTGIHMLAGEKISFYAKAHTSFAVIAIVKNGVYTPVVTGVDLNTYTLYEWTANTECDIVLSSGYDHESDYAIKGAILSEMLKSIQNNLTGSQVDPFGMTALTDNPLEHLTEGGMAGIVRSWGFIGDSMASGATVAYNKGEQTTSEIDDYWASWGQFICRMHGSEGYNYSAGGECAKSWCLNSKDNDREWDKLKTAKHEAYIIALGQNDTYWVNSDDSNTQIRNYPCITAYPDRASFQTEGLNITEADIRNDIDINDYENNAQTFVGYYAGIIQRIKSVNELGYIFLMTNPQSEAPNQPIYYKYYNDCIRHIYNIFKNIYPDTLWLIEMDKYSRYKDIKTNIALNGLHFGAFGYKWSALEINTYIDYIIRNNITEFQSLNMVLFGKKATQW